MTKTHRIGAVLLAALAVTVAWAARPAATEDGISVYFSPDGGCTDAIIHEVDGARLSVLVQAYSFTSSPIAKAILEAQKRGVEVTVVLDSSQRTAKHSSATFFRNQGVSVFIDARHAIVQNKIILIDDQTIITGSFNFSKAAENSNAENPLVINDKPTLQRAYRRNFDEHLRYSAEYGGLGKQVEDDTPAPDEDAVGGTTVYTTASGTKYRRAGCRYLSKSQRTTTVRDAKRRGLAPCKVCTLAG